MSDTNEREVLLVTGAGRGMGTDIAKAALAVGYKTVATGRDIKKVTEAVGASDNLLVVKLDVTNPGRRASRGQSYIREVWADRCAGQ